MAENANKALLYATENDSLEGVKAALEAGADIDYEEPASNATLIGTALFIACDLGHVDIVRLLLRKGASLVKRTFSAFTPLHGAAFEVTSSSSLRVEVAENRCSVEESYNLIEVAKKTKLLRCCNPKCGKPSYRKTLKLCGRCKLTRYCSRDCQKQHWSVGHKKCCGHDVYSYEQTDPYERIVMSLTKLALEDE
uniref:MYND-type domain-containing protein n=1 Tax=Branchiostoma floridae TaxID=7739 RepID=C3YSE8_BRAFL|eukprot:XP_002601041.1 hypothetical protein BRAFLDRAFT_128144 [Branchiostoma floridae]